MSASLGGRTGLVKIKINIQAFIPAILCLLMACGGSLLATTPPRTSPSAAIPAQAAFDEAVSGSPTNYLFSLSTNASRTMAFAPANGNQAVNTRWLATNSTLWTWPVNLSCVGFAPNVGVNGNLIVLIAPRLVYFANHLAGVIGTNIIFHDVGGALWIGTITKEIHFQGDMALGHLRDPAPASIVLPYILPPDAVTNFPGGGSGPVPVFWLHNSQAQIESAFTHLAHEAHPTGLVYENYLAVNSSPGPFLGTPATIGDSSSPLFTLYRRDLIFLGTASTGGSRGRLGYDFVGGFSYISGPDNFSAWQRSGLTNGVRILADY
jgi:hypothetical protein